MKGKGDKKKNGNENESFFIFSCNLRNGFCAQSLLFFSLLNRFKERKQMLWNDNDDAFCIGLWIKEKGSKRGRGGQKGMDGKSWKLSKCHCNKSWIWRMKMELNLHVPFHGKHYGKWNTLENNLEIELFIKTWISWIGGTFEFSSRSRLNFLCLKNVNSNSFLLEQAWKRTKKETKNSVFIESTEMCSYKH